MSPILGRERLITTKEFDRWWQTQGLDSAQRALLDPAAAQLLAWEAWRQGREQMYEATTSYRLQPAPK